MEAKEFDAEFKNPNTSGPQSIALPLVLLTETMAFVHVRVVLGCQIYCVIVHSEASGRKIVLFIVSTAT